MHLTLINRVCVCGGGVGVDSKAGGSKSTGSISVYSKAPTTVQKPSGSAGGVEGEKPCCPAALLPRCTAQGVHLLGKVVWIAV